MFVSFRLFITLWRYWSVHMTGCWALDTLATDKNSTKLSMITIHIYLYYVDTICICSIYFIVRCRTNWSSFFLWHWCSEISNRFWFDLLFSQSWPDPDGCEWSILATLTISRGKDEFRWKKKTMKWTNEHGFVKGEIHWMTNIALL